MPITILQPSRALPPASARDSHADSDSEGGADLDGDISMEARPAKPKRAENEAIVTPGEVITSSRQWMR